MTKGNSKVQNARSSPEISTPTKKVIKKTKPVQKNKDRPPGVKPKLGSYPAAKPGQPGIQYPYRIGKSKYDGVGIFFLQDIPKGSLVWKYDQDVNVLVLKNKKEVLAYIDSIKSEKDIKLILEYAYCWKGRVNVLLDHTNFVNHGEEGDANIGVDYDKDVQSTYALRDIKKGEEWFEDYGVFEFPPWYAKILKQYGCNFSFVENIPKSMK